MGVGDELLAAGQAQRYFYESGGESSYIVDRHGAARWHPIWQDNPAIVEPAYSGAPVDGCHHVITNGPNCRPYIVYPFTEDTGWTFNRNFRARDHVAKIYLTDVELRQGRQLRDLLGDYVLIDPWSKHPNLRWPLEHWQTLVNSCPDIRFVQHVWGQAPRLDNVVLVDTPSFRAACGILASAALYIRGESGMCHAAAALDKPQITIWGGCMDWQVLGGYEKQFGLLSDNGPCGRYRACLHCERVMRGITPAMVASIIDVQF